MSDLDEQRPAGGPGEPPPEVPPVFPIDDRPFVERRNLSPTTFAGLSLVVIVFLYGVVGTVVSLALFGMGPDLTKPGGFRLFTAVSQVVLLLLPALLLARLASRTPLDFLRARRAPSWQVVLASMAGVFSLQMLLQVYLVFQDMIPLPPEAERLVTSMKDTLETALTALLSSSTFPEFLAVTVVIAILPAVTEEFLFRGLIQRSFERGIGPVRAFVLTGMIFGAFHLNPFTIVPLMALGVYLGFVAWRADTLWASAAAHFFNNLLPVAAAYFGVADEEVVKGDLGDLSTLQLFTVFWFSGVIFLLSTYYFLHVTARTPATGGGAGASDRS